MVCGCWQWLAVVEERGYWRIRSEVRWRSAAQGLCGPRCAGTENGSAERRSEICVTATRFYGITEALVVRVRGLAPTAIVMSALRA